MFGFSCLRGFIAQKNHKTATYKLSSKRSGDAEMICYKFSEFLPSASRNQNVP
jgi:hypothetical protein